MEVKFEVNKREFTRALVQVKNIESENKSIFILLRNKHVFVSASCDVEKPSVVIFREDFQIKVKSENLTNINCDRENYYFWFLFSEFDEIITYLKSVKTEKIIISVNKENVTIDKRKFSASLAYTKNQLTYDWFQKNQICKKIGDLSGNELQKDINLLKKVFFNSMHAKAKINLDIFPQHTEVTAYAFVNRTKFFCKLPEMQKIVNFVDKRIIISSLFEYLKYYKLNNKKIEVFTSTHVFSTFLMFKIGKNIVIKLDYKTMSKTDYVFDLFLPVEKQESWYDLFTAEGALIRKFVPEIYLSKKENEGEEYKKKLVIKKLTRDNFKNIVKDNISFQNEGTSNLSKDTIFLFPKDEFIHFYIEEACLGHSNHKVYVTNQKQHFFFLLLEYISVK